MAKKSKERCTFYPFSDPKHCRKPQQEDNPAVEVSNLALLLRGGSIPEEGTYTGQQYAVYLFMDGELELRVQAVDLLAFYH